jgi:hypothetical protein
MQAFGYFRSVLGSLLVGYSGSPLISSRCNNLRCRHIGSFDVHVTYTFPGWFVAYTLSAIFQASRNGTWKFGLTARKRVELDHDTLLWASEHCNANEVRRLVESKPMLMNEIHVHDGQSPLHLAFLLRENGTLDFDLLQVFLQAGASSDQENDAGSTPLIVVTTISLMPGYSQEIRDGLSRLFSISKGVEELELTFLHKVVCGILTFQ